MKDLTKLDVPSDEKICDLFMDQVITACLTASLESGLFDALADKKMFATELAENLNSHPGSVTAVCNVLSAANVLEKFEENYVASESTQTYLRKSSPLYRGFQFKGDGLWHEKIVTTLKSGWSPIGADGKSFTDMWEKGSLSQEAANRFTGMMHTDLVC